MELYKLPRINDYEGDLSKRWYIQFAYRDADTQKFVEIRKWIPRAHKTKTARYHAAKVMRDNLLTKLAQGWNPLLKDRNIHNVEVSLRKLIEAKAPTLRKRTWHSYRSIAGIFCEWLRTQNLSGIVPAQVNKHLAQRFLDESLTVEKINPRTYNNRLRTLRTLFNDLLQRDTVDWNVWAKFKLLQETEPDLVAYTAEEKLLIKDHIAETKPELWLAAMFVYYGFVRPAEMVRLKLMYIGWDNKCLLIPGNVAKNKKTKTIILPDQLFELLIKMGYDKLPQHLYIFSNDRKLTPGEKEIASNRIFNQWKECVMDPLGIKKTIYLFKHTGAGELFESKADPRNIQLQLRHSSLEETLEYLRKYSNRPNESLRGHFKTIQ